VQASHFPKGDSAEYLDEWLSVIDDYETWAAKWRSKSICHITDKEDHVWWFGFDCVHLGDLAPKMKADLALLGMPKREPIPGYEETYKNIAYVTEEVKNLAKQLKAMT
jgi:hypothetical protein